MTNISRDIFKAIHEGKWLQLEYRNKQAEITHYWFAIENIDIDIKNTNITIITCKY